MSGAIANVGQHLFIGFNGRELNATNRRLLNTIQPGGVVLFTRNIGDRDELRALVTALHHELAYRPLVAIDQENGRVNRLRDIVGELPGIADLKQAGGPERAAEFGGMLGRWLHQSGIDLDFAPVLDLELFDEQTDNALRDRCWGRTAAEVVRWAGAFLEGLERQGVAGCPKHFPGLGGAALDSHEKLPTIDRRREDLLREDIEPYRHLLPRLTAVMVGHGRYPALDDQPASLSHAIITGLLRQQLGFTGLVLTDDLEMGAITDFESAVPAAIEAGADMLLVCHTPAKALAAHEILSKLPVERLTASRERIQQFQNKWIGQRI